MTSKLLKNSKSKLILVLLLISVLCLSLFSVACNKEDDDANNKAPSFSYTQTDDGDISNPTFNYGTLDTELKNFPKTSVTGWSRSKDTNSSINSASAKSGVINVSEDGWKELVNALYKDSSIKAYIERYADTNTITEDTIKNAIKEEKGNNDYSPSSDEIKEYFIENYLSELFTNPGKSTNNGDDYVYMLNNYLTSSKIGLGTSQKITSSSSISLEKGKYGKISVWVKTINLDMTSGDYGANIRVISKFNGETQADYVVTGISTNGAWKEYTVYVKADDYFDTSFSIALGLGYDLSGVTQGTAFFDDVTFEEVTALPTQNFTAKDSYFAYNGDEPIKVDASTLTTETPVFNISFAEYVNTIDDAVKVINNVAPNFFKTDIVNIDANQITESNTGKNGKPFTSSVINVNDDADKDTLKVKKVELTNASATLRFTNKYTVKPGEYTYLAFYVKNELNAFGSQSITFDIVERSSSDEILKTTPAVASITQADDEWQKVSLIVKNNFESVDRYFTVNVVVGPADVVSAKYTYDFASGSAYITAPVVATIKTNAPVKEDFDNTVDGQKEFNDAKEIYDLYSELYSILPSTANGSTALYAGYSSDFTDSSDTETYALTTAPSDIGTITHSPATVKGYQGIVANHSYIKADSTNAKINTNKESGLINTKYLFKNGDVETSVYNNNAQAIVNALGINKDDDAIQPLMIYNKDAGHYGYIGESKTISSSSYAKVSVTLKVVDDAVAYIYLVDVSGENKDVLTLSVKDKTYKRQLKITEQEMNSAKDGWLTVDFFVATGADAIDFRVEMWNGARDGQDATKSQGFVFIKEVNVSTSGAFSEPSSVEQAFVSNDNPLYTEKVYNQEDIKNENLIKFTRELTKTEEKFNNEFKSDSSVEKVEYKATYVWADNATMIYAIYNTINPVEVNPYDNLPEEDDTSDGCTAETDPSTFWLSFSSILLAVVLLIAIIMLVVKNIRRRRKANASDAKSHFKITSRTKSNKTAKTESNAEVEQTVDTEEVVEEETIAEETTEEVVEQPAETEEQPEQEETENQNLDSYVYGDVQVFGEEKDENKD